MAEYYQFQDPDKESPITGILPCQSVVIISSFPKFSLHMCLDLLAMCLTPALGWKTPEGRDHVLPNGEKPIIPKSDVRNMAASWAECKYLYCI